MSAVTISLAILPAVYASVVLDQLTPACKHNLASADLAYYCRYLVNNVTQNRAFLDTVYRKRSVKFNFLTANDLNNEYLDTGERKILSNENSKFAAILPSVNSNISRRYFPANVQYLTRDERLLLARGLEMSGLVLNFVILLCALPGYLSLLSLSCTTFNQFRFFGKLSHSENCKLMILSLFALNFSLLLLKYTFPSYAINKSS